MIRTRARLGLIVLSGTALATSLPAFGQESGASGGSPQPSGEEIVVTARKSNERIQDVPISVTALSADALRDRGATDLQDVLRNIPGLSNSGAERGLSRYAIRGLYTAASSPTVGIYLDDISLVTISTTFSGALDPVFFDMERIEVLKGPQGTLYGGSAMGGAIKYVSARPDLDAFGFDGAIGAATTAHGAPSYTGEAVVNVPIVTGKLALRGGVYYRRDGGYVDALPGDVQTINRSSTPQPLYTPLRRPSLSTRNDKDINFADTWAARASLEWQPDESWSIRPQIFHQDYEQADNSHFFLGRTGLSSSFRIEQPSADTATVYSLSVEKDLGGVQVTSLTSQFDRHFTFVRDYSYFVSSLFGQVPSLAPLEPLVYPLVGYNLSDSRTSTFSQEVRLASANPDARFKWLIGGYYADQDDRLVQSLEEPGTELIFGTQQLFFGDTFTNTKQYALFGEASFGLFDGLELTAGVRLFEIRQTVAAVNDGPLFGPRAEITGRKSKESGVNPKVGLSYKLTPDNLLYASAAKGFRPGGPNRYPINPVTCGAALAEVGLNEAPDAFQSDSLWTYEVGTKNMFGAGRATVNGAAYLTKWNDIQQQVGLSCGFGFNTNVGKAEVKGFELEGRFELVPGLEVGGTATYTDTEITEAALGTGITKGDAIPLIPKWAATAYAGFSAELGNGWDMNLRGEYQYQGRAFYDPPAAITVTYPGGVPGPAIPNPGRYQESFDVVNLSAGLGKDGTSIRLYANNLLNERPLLDVDYYTGSDRARTIRPRTIGVELRQSF